MHQARAGTRLPPDVRVFPGAGLLLQARDQIRPLFQERVHSTGPDQGQPFVTGTAQHQQLFSSLDLELAPGLGGDDNLPPHADGDRTVEPNLSFAGQIKPSSRRLVSLVNKIYK
jgi:hypothetical protein